MDGVSRRPGTVSCETDMGSPPPAVRQAWDLHPQLAASIWEEGKWGWTPEGAVAPAHSRKALSAKDSRPQSNPSSACPTPTSNKLPVGSDPEVGTSSF